jgi:hypothetical protein
MHMRIKIQIILIDNLIINSQFIGSQQTHRKRRLHRIEPHEDHGAHGIEDQRERRSHLVTRYGPEGLKLTTHASLKGQQGWWRAPPWSIPPPAECRKKSSRWDLARTETCGDGKSILWTPPRVFGFMVIYSRGIRSNGARGPRGTTARPLVACRGDSWPPHVAPISLSKLPVYFPAKKKSPKSFMPFGLRLIWIFCKTRNMQITTTGSGH